MFLFYFKFQSTNTTTSNNFENHKNSANMYHRILKSMLSIQTEHNLQSIIYVKQNHIQINNSNKTSDRKINTKLLAEVLWLTLNAAKIILVPSPSGQGSNPCLH